LRDIRRESNIKLLKDKLSINQFNRFSKSLLRSNKFQLRPNKFQLRPNKPQPRSNQSQSRSNQLPFPLQFK
jgi:hypothetical protein